MGTPDTPDTPDKRAVIPDVLRQLGYQGMEVAGVEVILPPLCPIPAGPFLMGSDPQRDRKAWPIELPQHEVEMSVFHIGTYPLTVAEYVCAVRYGAMRELRTNRGEAWGPWEAQVRTMTNPVVNLRWQDALAYAAWLSRVTGQRWRLSTEAEWEKAARGVDGRIYPWGDQFDARRANTDESGLGHITPINAYPNGASPYGVMDMIGNVYEWTSSAWQPYPYVCNDGREALDADVTWRVSRGGAFYDYANNARAATRWPLKIERWEGLHGCRLVRDIS